MTLLRNARVMTCTGDGLGVIDRGAIATVGGEVAWVGDDAQAPSGDGEVIDCGGKLVTPGLVDCHTHAIFAGSRAHEFAMRARGASYHEIAKAGGGIAATLAATRAAGDDELARSLDDRIAAMRRAGTTTIEVKSGYDLTVDGELRLIRVAARPHVVRTLLAHVVPPERAGDRDAFVREICDDWIPRARARSVDVYCDDGAFTLAESRTIWEAAKRAGMAVRGHVGQFADLGGAELLAELGALSADHLENVGDAGIAALARSRTVAVMLPGACVQLRMKPPPVDKLRAAGVAMAVATDFNPGTSYCETLPIQMWLACTHYGMTVDEAWLGVTRVAARALDLTARGVGTIAPGAPADLVVWNASDPADIPYRYGADLVNGVLTA
jgi:imidazolonepropionase